ncbi:glycosyltransferase family A protein [Burkholderia sp.]|uniref:glycosyltransferase family 2 protein n=1 Tax=Burkholderia sp. TaxID=36773 RepID=UPI0025850391|nr:glycosyltransferase family A protein [Burkholderia sp.]
MTAPRPRVTVALPMFNAQRTIRSAIGSILAQTMPDFELLLIDDGSTDCTLQHAGAFDDRRVRLVAGGTNKGLAARLNESIAMARGEYFARMDADDLAYPDRLKYQLAFLESNPQIDLVGTRALVFDDAGGVIGLFPWRQTHAAICARPWNGFYLPHPTWMGRTAWFRLHRYAIPEPVRSEDQELLLRAFVDSRFACLPQVLLGYRQGLFNLRKSLAARRSLGVAQWRIHSSRGCPELGLLGATVSAGKAAVDCLSALPGLQRFRLRPGEPASASEHAVWADLAARHGIVASNAS